MWAQPGAQAEVLRLTDGRTILAWERIISDDVWLVREGSLGADGRIVAGPTMIHVAEHQDGLDAARARELAALGVDAGLDQPACAHSHI